MPDHVHMCIAISLSDRVLERQERYCYPAPVWERAELFGRAFLGPWAPLCQPAVSNWNKQEAANGATDSSERSTKARDA
jgi:hypothetical protein